jgi:hypothetical protein
MTTDKTCASVEVATNGHIDRDDKCQACGRGMLFRVDTAGQPVSMFCGGPGSLIYCDQALKEIKL